MQAGSHGSLPRGEVITSPRRLAGVEFYHVSWSRRFTVGQIMRAADFQLRPHYELFREPPESQFLSIPRFLPDRRLEAEFERVRLRVAPHAPSRRTCLFAFVCKECAQWFRSSAPDRNNGQIIRTAIDSGGSAFVSDLVWRNVAANVLLRDFWRSTDFPFPTADQDSALASVAQAYWQGDDPTVCGLETRPEVLIQGNLMVLEILPD